MTVISYLAQTVVKTVISASTQTRAIPPNQTVVNMYNFIPIPKEISMKNNLNSEKYKTFFEIQRK